MDKISQKLYQRIAGLILARENCDIKEYIAESFHNALSTEVA